MVDSLISHLADSLDNRIQESWSESRTTIRGDAPVAADRCERIDQSARAPSSASSSPALLAVLDAIAAHCEPKPQAIAQHLGTTVADVNNRLKRLRRFALKVVQDERSGVTTR